MNEERLKAIDLLLNSDIKENKLLGSLLLQNDNLTKEEILERVSSAINLYIKYNQIEDSEILNNFIDAYVKVSVPVNRINKI